MVMDSVLRELSNFECPGDSSDDSRDNAPLNPEAEGLVDRCTVLLEEVEAFQRSLRRNKLEKGVELRHFHGSLKSELRGLQMVCSNNRDFSVFRNCHREYSVLIVADILISVNLRCAYIFRCPTYTKVFKFVLSRNGLVCSQVNHRYQGTYEIIHHH